MSEGNEEATYPPKTLPLKDGVTDSYGDKRSELDSPANYAFAITPSQGLLPTTIRGLYIGTTGNVCCAVAGGNTTHASANVDFAFVVAGTILPVSMVGVYDVNSENSDQTTTSKNLVGLY